MRSSSAPAWPYRLNRGASPFLDQCRAFYVAAPGTMVNLVEGHVMSAVGDARVDVPLDDLPMRAARLDGAGDRYDAPSDEQASFSLSQPYTIAWCSYLSAFTTGYPQVCLFHNAAGGGPVMVGYSNQSGYTDIYTGRNGTAFQWAKPASVTILGNRHWGVYTFRGGLATSSANYSLWVNGQAFTPSGTSLSGYTGGTKVGGNGGFVWWDGDVPYVMFAQKAWSQELAHAWSGPATRFGWARRRDARTVSIVPAAGGSTVEGAVSFALSAGMTSTADLVAEASAALGLTAGISAASDVSVEAAASLGISADLAPSADLTAEAAVSLAVDADLTPAAVQTAESSFALGVNSDLSHSGGAVRDAALSAGLSLAMTGASEITIEGVIGLDAQLAVAAAVVATWEASAPVSAVMGATASATAELQAAASLGLQAGQTFTGGQTLEAGVTVAVTLTAGTDGAIAVEVSVTTPDERTLTIHADGRTLTIHGDDRTLSIRADDRTLNIH